MSSEGKRDQMQIIEGTWKELSTRADEFRGRRLRLIVLPEEGNAFVDSKKLHEAAAQIIEEADKVERKPGKSSNDPPKTIFP